MKLETTALCLLISVLCLSGCKRVTVIVPDAEVSIELPTSNIPPSTSHN